MPVESFHLYTPLYYKIIRVAIPCSGDIYWNIYKMVMMYWLYLYTGESSDDGDYYRNIFCRSVNYQVPVVLLRGCFAGKKCNSFVPHRYRLSPLPTMVRLYGEDIIQYTW